jgi:hypothetical protein
MVANPKGPEKDYDGEGQQHVKRQTCPLVREGAPENKTITVRE